MHTSAQLDLQGLRLPADFPLKMFTVLIPDLRPLSWLEFS